MTQRLERSRRITDVLDVRRPIWSLGSKMDSGCALHEESLLDIQRRRERTRHDPQRRSVLRGSQTFKIVIEGSKHAGTQSYDSSRGLPSGTGKGTRCGRNPRVPLQEQRWTAMESPQCVSRFPQALRRPQLKKERCTLQDMSLIEAGVNGALRRQRRTSHI